MATSISFDLSTKPIAQATELALVDFGQAGGGSNVTIQDIKKHWVVNEWADGEIKIIKPNGNEYTRVIASNTANTITFAALPAGVAGEAGDIYVIRGKGVGIDMPTLASLTRWGRDVTPTWVHGVEVPNPPLGTALVTQAVGAGVVGYVYGFFAAAQEANNFLLNWTSGGNPYSIRLPFGGLGFAEDVQIAPINEGLAADAGTNITITNAVAGALGMIYQARLLYAEV